MSGDSHQLTTPFLQILHNTLMLWLEETAVFYEALIQTILADEGNLYQALDKGLQYAATWEVAAQVVCQTRLFASRQSQHAAWLGLVARALVWCQEPNQLRVELLLVQGQLQRDTNNLPAAFATFAEAERLIMGLQSHTLHLRLLANQAETYQEDQKPQLAKDLCLQGLARLHEGQFEATPLLPRWHVGLLHILGSAQRDLGDLDAAQATLEKAVALSKQVDELTYIRALNALGRTYARAEKVEEAQLTYALCFALLDKLPYNNDKVLICNNAGSFCAGRQLWQDAELFFMQAVAFARSVPVSRKAQAITFNNVGYFLSQQKRLEEAQYFLERAATLYRSLDVPLMLANTLGNLGHVYMAKGDWLAARENYDAALQLLEPLLPLPRAQSLREEFVEPRRRLDGKKIKDQPG